MPCMFKFAFNWLKFSDHWAFVLEYILRACTFLTFLCTFKTRMYIKMLKFCPHFLMSAGWSKGLNGGKSSLRSFSLLLIHFPTHFRGSVLSPGAWWGRCLPGFAFTTSDWLLPLSSGLCSRRQIFLDPVHARFRPPSLAGEQPPDLPVQPHRGRQRYPFTQLRNLSLKTSHPTLQSGKVIREYLNTPL